MTTYVASIALLCRHQVFPAAVGCTLSSLGLPCVGLVVLECCRCHRSQGFVVGVGAGYETHGLCCSWRVTVGAFRRWSWVVVVIAGSSLLARRGHPQVVVVVPRPLLSLLCFC